MARTDSKNPLSGAVGNIVFVKDGNRTYVRSKPHKVKQSKATKAAGALFGLVSKKEKMLRENLLALLGFPALQYFAARHRAVLRKTAVATEKKAGNVQAVFGSPEALAGFEFNPQLEWRNCTNFFPSVGKKGNTKLEILLPLLQWGTQIKAPKGSRAAVVKLHAVSINMNESSPKITPVSELQISVLPQKAAAAQSWTFNKPAEAGWLVVVASLFFEGAGAGASAHSGCYLWAGETGS